MKLEAFDVVVAGCGVAGLSAAVAAAEAGARVVVLERAPEAERGGPAGKSAGRLNSGHGPSVSMAAVLVRVG